MEYQIKHFIKYLALIFVTVGVISAVSICMIKLIINNDNVIPQTPARLANMENLGVRKVCNIFAIEVSRYKRKASDQRNAFAAAKAIWLKEACGLFSV